MEAIESVMTQLELLPLFSVVISSESVNRGKPHPDVFLVAAEKLNAAPKECVVLEDSLVGVQAALAAGMKCIAVPSGDAAVAARMKELGARIVGSLEEVRWEEIARMVN
jgi:beta-phosphoglucomutase-like phosphatase (HAD superfamily)